MFTQAPAHIYLSGNMPIHYMHVYTSRIESHTAIYIYGRLYVAHVFPVKTPKFYIVWPKHPQYVHEGKLKYPLPKLIPKSQQWWRMIFMTFESTVQALNAHVSECNVMTCEGLNPQSSSSPLKHKLNSLQILPSNEVTRCWRKWPWWPFINKITY